MKKIFTVSAIVTIICLLFTGICFASENEVLVSLNSPASTESFSPGGDVEISGTAENVRQVSLIVFNPAGSIAYVAQPSVENGVFSTGFQLNNDAMKGTYTIKIGAEGLGEPLEFTFKVGEGSTSPVTGGGSPGGASTTTEVITGNNVTNVTTSAGTQDFNDTNGHWATGSINQLVALGAINGYPDGSFKPDKTISRAEFAAVLVKAFNLDKQGDITFQDTVNHWGRDYIAAAVSSGVANGYSANAFGPDDPITREQMAVMIVRAAGLETAAGEIKFKDNANISNWAREAIATMNREGLMQGYGDNTFLPLNSATRGEAVTVIVNALKIIKP